MQRKMHSKVELKKIKRLLHKYKQKLGLEQYFIEIAIADDEHILSDRNSKRAKFIKSDCYAELNRKDDISKDYLIIINRFATKSEVKDTIQHELIHILLWEMRSMLESVMELTDIDNKLQNKIMEKSDRVEHLIVEKLIKLLKK